MESKTSVEHSAVRNVKTVIYELDGSPCVVTGYAHSPIKSAIVIICYVLTLGLLRLFFSWIPRWMLKCTHSVSPLLTADTLLIQDAAGVYNTVSVKTVFFDVTSGVVYGPYSKGKTPNNLITFVNETCQQGNVIVYFVYKCMKYVLDDANQQFILLSEAKHRSASIFPTCPLSDATVNFRRALYEANDIPIRVTPILKLIFSTCTHMFYCFQLFSCILWFTQDYWKYAVCILVMSIISLCYQIYQQHRNEVTLKKKMHSTAKVIVCREKDGSTEYYDVDSTELVPGDLIEIPPNGCTMHCDAFLLSGNCIVNESALTGESVPVTKTPLPENQRHNENAAKPATLARHVLYGGTSVIQTRNYAGERVMAVVIRTGFSTAKGELVRSILYPKAIKFKFNQDTRKFIGALSAVAALGLIVSAYLMYRAGVEISDIVKRALDVITIAVPPALPLALDAGILLAQKRLRKDDIFCINPKATLVCGVINVTCFDKTGTLTEDGMDLWGVLPSHAGQFKPAVSDPEQFDPCPLLEAMATCHSLTQIDGVLSGDPLDLKMFQSTKWEFNEQVFEDHCKFDMAVPASVRPPKKRTSEQDVSGEAVLDGSGIPYEIGILRQFPFSSSLQRMSVVARVLSSSHFSIYTKGAPELIETLCRRDTLPSNYQSVLLHYTREGYRVLALAWRPLKIPYTRVMRIQREQAEQDLHFLGLLVMENRLKPETAPVIQELQCANIRPVMVTGDNILTALSVARDCEMIGEYDRVIIVSAKLPSAAKSLELASGGDDLKATITQTQTGGDSPLVTFHYAEDLHKPVTEVMTTNVRRPFKSRGTNSVSCAKDLESGCVEIVPGATARVNLRMVDRSDFHLAISGKTWAVIKEHYPWLIPKLAVKGTVFARFSPDQKTQLIEALQSVGYYVAMCGDGANDCGALKVAHAGISLSDAEASVASPFTSKRQNIACVPNLIRQGRCALVTNFGMFKFMTGYSLLQFFSIILLYTIGSNLSDNQYLYIDIFLILFFSFTFGYSGAHSALSIEPPPIRLLSTITLLSIGLQLLISYGFQVFAYFWIRTQPWYTALYQVSDDYELMNYENSAVFRISAYQYVIIAIVFAKGPPYRKPIYTNYLFMVNIVACIGLTFYTTMFATGWYAESMELLPIPSSKFLWIIHSTVLTNFLVCYICEFCLDRVAFRQRLRHIRKALFPRLVRRKDYERIREELDKLAGNWPPIIRSASVQDLPKELFHDHALAPTNSQPGSPCKSVSSCNFSISSDVALHQSSDSLAIGSMNSPVGIDEGNGEHQGSIDRMNTR